MTALQLDDALHARIVAHTDAGNLRCDREDYRGAIDDYAKALALLPAPVEEWEAATWILTALGDCRFLLGEFDAARTDLRRALQAPGGDEIGFVYLRLGQCEFECNDLAAAGDALARAYMSDGAEGFEDEDPKYYDWLRTKMRGLPPLARPATH